MYSRLLERVLLIRMTEVLSSLRDIESYLGISGRKPEGEKEQQQRFDGDNSKPKKTDNRVGKESIGNGKHTDLMVLIEHYRVFKEEVSHK